MLISYDEVGVTNITRLFLVCNIFAITSWKKDMVHVIVKSVREKKRSHENEMRLNVFKVTHLVFVLVQTIT